jgi:DNA-binding IclR family transcriptional regulator
MSEMPEAAVPNDTSIDDKDILRFLRDQEPWPVISTEVADAFGISQQAAYSRLASLNESGEVSRRKANRRTVMWRVSP